METIMKLGIKTLSIVRLYVIDNIIGKAVRSLLLEKKNDNISEGAIESYSMAKNFATPEKITKAFDKFKKAFTRR
uniref:DUF4325 domain-containing protein n=1 Tax=Strongyloides venezuelensis TaxID=75913 RepID=A0A0K0FFU6_STRVS